MLIRVFTLAFEPMTGRFNDDPVRDFIADKEVASIRDHFFLKDDTPYLALVVCNRPAGLAAAPQTPAPAGPRQRDESWRTTVDQADWPLFNTLRDWRGERARADGIPSYVICNNRQLAEVVNKRPGNLAELGHLDGFGDAKLKKYSAEMLGSSPMPVRARRRPPMPGNEPEELPIFTHWVQFLEWLLPATERFPKRVRFTCSDRIDNLALDIALELVEARYTRDKLCASGLSSPVVPAPASAGQKAPGPRRLVAQAKAPRGVPAGSRRARAPLSLFSAPRAHRRRVS